MPRFSLSPGPDGDGGLTTPKSKQSGPKIKAKHYGSIASHMMSPTRFRLYDSDDDDESDDESDDSGEAVSQKTQQQWMSSFRLMSLTERQSPRKLSTVVDPSLPTQRTAHTPTLIRHHYRIDPQLEEDVEQSNWPSWKPWNPSSQSLFPSLNTENDSLKANLSSLSRAVQRNLHELAQSARREMDVLRRKIDLERREIRLEAMKAEAKLRQSLEEDDAAANETLEQVRKLQEQRRREAELERRRIEAERRRYLAEQEELERRAKEVERKRLERQRELQRQKEEALRKKFEYVTKAKASITKLSQLKDSIKIFEQSADARKRRLKMKKVAGGKLNTLAREAGKIREVAEEVIKAISESKEEDDRIKEETKMSANDEDAEIPDMAKGKPYFLDLLASNVIVRVQAEGFNGTRGDGFPLANMLALVAAEFEDFGPVLAAHIYSVCPTAIPTLPTPKPGSTEEDLMETLGMNKNSDGEYETFDRFLARTEGLISIVAEIMSSIPPEHSLLQGHKGAVDWLGRFLSILPPKPQSPLPLLTAPVLVAFLTGAGHMMANKFPDEFRKHLNVIMSDVAKRLDEGTIGQPSATRLKKVLEGGFDSFQREPPPGVVGELYDGSKGGILPRVKMSLSTTRTTSTASMKSNVPTSFGSFGGGSDNFAGVDQGMDQDTGHLSSIDESGMGDAFSMMETFDAVDSFGGGPSFGNASMPFGGGGRGRKPPPCKFFAQGRCRNGDNCKFSHEIPASGGPGGAGFGGSGGAGFAGLGRGRGRGFGSFGGGRGYFGNPFGS